MGGKYLARTARYLSFAEARGAFAAGEDTPRAFLERCIEQLERLEPQVQAFVRIDVQGARLAADAATERWRKGMPLSVVDGLPVGIKDCFDVRGWPTEVNCKLFEGRIAEIDAAHVAGLRRGGALLLGKTTTTELTMATPPPTRNPWDLERTPGGSSAGSAAAVAARILPIATGSQVRGSVIRPASICGVIGMKPTFGALNRYGGVDPSPSLNHLGLLGGTLTDVWEVAHHIGVTAGGDPGFVALSGPATLPAERRPLRLARQYTCGWPKTDAASQEAFERLLRALQACGVEILEPTSGPELQRYEEATARTPEFIFDLMAFELRWPLGQLNEIRPGQLSEAVLGYLHKAQSMSQQEYGQACDRREELRALHRALTGRVDGFITLAHIGPGQLGQPKIGTPWYNDASSIIGAPTFNLPLLEVDGVPLGVQIMGFENRDADLAAIARWILAAQELPQLL